jgi:hypothetical protein
MVISLFWWRVSIHFDCSAEASAPTAPPAPMCVLWLQLGVRPGLIEEEMLLVAQAFAGRAIEDPVLLPLVDLLRES